MNKFKETIAEEKKNMPDYQYKFLYHGVLPGMIFVIAGAVVVLILGMILYFATDSTILPFIPLIIWGVITIILLVLFVIYNKKYSLKLLEEKTLEFEKEYKIVDYQKALKKLEEIKIVNDKITIDDNEYFIDDFLIMFFCKTLSGRYFFRLEFYDKKDKRLIFIINLDKYLCTYFSNHVHLINNSELFELFLNNKKKFLQYLYKYNDTKKMYERCLKDLNLCFDREKRLKGEFGFLIERYGFKFKKEI